MKYDKKYLGKWVAVNGEKVVSSDESLERLIKKVDAGKYKNKVVYDSIPKHYITGYAVQ